MSDFQLPDHRPLGRSKRVTRFWRSVGDSHNVFFFDTFIDELAHAAAADPLQFRLDLAKDEHAPFAGVIVAVDEMLNWANDKPANIGRGIGFTYSFGTLVAEVVEVEDTDNRIKINE